MMSLPKGIYLEASVLFKLPRNVINAELERLKELSLTLDTQIFIPETSFKEWIANRKKTINDYIKDVEEGLAEMSKLFDYVSRINWVKKKQEIIADTELFTKKRIDEIGISVIETPPIDVRRLVSMAVDKIKPFEEKGEKGFRDSVNLFTVLEHAKKQDKGSHILIAKDNIYKEEGIQEHAREYGVELVVISSILEAISTIEEFLTQVKMLIDTYQKSILREFLLDNIDKISEYIRQHGTFPISFLNKNNCLGFWPKIEDVEVMNVKAIESLTRGVLPKGVEEGKVKISFNAITNFNIKVQELITKPKPKFKHGGQITEPIDIRLYLLGNSATQIVNKTIEIGVPVEGLVILKRGKNEDGYLVDKYSDLEITGIAV